MNSRAALFIPFLLLVIASLNPASAQRLSPLATAPQWNDLEPFQQTITRETFTRLLTTVYAPDGAADPFIAITDDAAHIIKQAGRPERFVLRFAKTEPTRPPPRYWRPAARMPAAPEQRPLEGIRIAIDPGHLGGRWARMEERWFRIGDGHTVQEGDMTLRVAELVKPMLEELGAEIFLVRTSDEPVTEQRPERLQQMARGEVEEKGTAIDDAGYERQLQWQSELLFYRISEIRSRGGLVNDRIYPDITLCLHFNAEGWGDPANPTFVERNHLHLLVNGQYSTRELAYDDQRHAMLVKLLTRSHEEELAASEVMAESLAEATLLPPYEYRTPNARHVGASDYVWARNLLANRIYESPVLYLEPYVMNSAIVYERIGLGEYKGEKLIEGIPRKNIFLEYAEGIRDGLVRYYRNTRPRASE